MIVNTVIVGADILVAELALSAATLNGAERSIVAHYGMVYQTRVRAAASGRPGPRAITGDYRRSITLEVKRDAQRTSAIVSTDRPQGRRLELGFVGVDSLGRHYNQPPYPHFGPPLQRTVDELARALIAAARLPA